MSDSILRCLARTAKAEGRDPLNDVPLFMARVRAEWWEPWQPQHRTGELADRILASGCCAGPDIDVPSVVCGHPMPCPRHPVSRQDRYELAAYLGHAGARELMGPRLWTRNGVTHDDDPSEGCRSYAGLHVPGTLCEDRSLELFLEGPQRWRPDRTWWVAGACAAGRVALKAFYNQQHERPCHGVPARALEAAEAWVADPSDENARACWRLVGPGYGSGLPLWASAPATMAAHEAGRMDLLPRAAADAARLATEPVVREALCRAWLPLVLP